MRTSFHKIFYPFASCLFVATLLLPFAQERLHFLPEATSNEQRVLAQLPEFKKDSLSSMSKKFDAYYGDNFGFRKVLVKMGSEIKCNLFHSSSKPDRINIGEDRWLYLAGSYYEVTQDLTRQNLYAPDSLKKAAVMWENRHRELLEMGIHYYKAIWPDKHYIYPEFMSPAMKLLDAGGPHRCDQGIDYIRQTGSPVKIVDVRKDLLDKKDSISLFYKFDSHWNSYAAFLAYTRLAAVIARDLPDVQPLTHNDVVVGPGTRAGGDLENLLSMEWQETQPYMSLKPGFKVGREISTKGYPPKTVIVENDSAQTEHVALIYRDSFTSSMIPYLSIHFKKIVLLWDVDYSIEMVKKVKPDVVMECYVTRYFR